MVASAAFVVIVAGWWGVQNWVFPDGEAALEQRRAEEPPAEERDVAEMGAALERQWAAMNPSILDRETVVDDPEGKLLWASPTMGPPIELHYVPAGMQCFVYLRLAELAAHPECEKVLAALGPWGQGAVEQLESLARAKIPEIDNVLAAVVVLPGGALDVCLRIQMMEWWDDAELLRRFPDAQAQKQGAQTLITVGDRAWFVPRGTEEAPNRTLVACPAVLAAELMESAGEPPLLARDMESLVAQSDADRVATIVLAPKFLLAGGNHLIEGDAAPLRDALAVLAGRDATAVSLSAHLSDSCFVELRAAPALTVSPRYLATTMLARLKAAGQTIEGQIKANAWPEYGRVVLKRFPAMFRRLAESARHAEADKQAVVRAYLPSVAGHNLLMGAELLLTQAGAAAGGAVRPAPTVEPPKTIAERLAATATLTFPKESLQRALELLSGEIGVAIVIDSPAFQAAGVTQNQTMGLELRDRAAGEILVEILRAANPDRTATGPGDPRQVLVYLVEPPVRSGDVAGADAADGVGRIIVTTRAAAAARGATLPAVFGVAGE